MSASNPAPLYNNAGKILCKACQREDPKTERYVLEKDLKEHNNQFHRHYKFECRKCDNVFWTEAERDIHEEEEKKNSTFYMSF